MDAKEMLEAKEAEEVADLKKQEENDAKKRDKEQQKAERAELEQQKRVEKEMRLATESRVTELLKSLGFTSSLSAEVTAGELQVFAKANKAALRTLGVDLTKLARKDLMPAMVHKLGSAQPGLQWVRAPPLALMPPRAGAAMEVENEPAPAGPALLAGPGDASAHSKDKTPPPMRPTNESEELPVHVTPPKPPEKRPRRRGSE